jgi:prepilin-type processing-associated H-X9-DG protein
LAISGIVLGSLSSLLLVPILLALMIPAVQASREAARRAQCVNNLKQVGIAFNNMDSREDHFPADSIKDANGKPLLSWRVAILPYIDQEALYKEFKLDEPWDSPTNQALLARMPGTYRCPSDPAAPGMTRYEAIVGAGTAFEGGTPHTIKQITDGTANTILVIEGATPVPWTKPDDLDIAQVGSSIGGKHIRIANALFADGSVRSIKKDTAGAILQALATCAGGEMISPDAY